MALVGLAALVSLVLEYGFHLGARTMFGLEVLDYALAAAFGFDLLLGLRRSRARAEVLRRRWHEYVLLLLFGVTVLVLAVFETDGALPEFLDFIHLRSVTKLCLALVQLFLVLNLLVRLPKHFLRF